MKSQLQPGHLPRLILAGWINRRQQDTVECLLTKNWILRDKPGKKRSLLSDNQRRRLAVKRKDLGRRALEAIATIVTLETILHWYREVSAADFFGRDLGPRRGEQKKTGSVSRRK